MGTILDYLKEYGDYSLEEKPFGDVDSLVFSGRSGGRACSDQY